MSRTNSRAGRDVETVLSRADTYLLGTDLDLSPDQIRGRLQWAQYRRRHGRLRKSLDWTADRWFDASDWAMDRAYDAYWSVRELLLKIAGRPTARERQRQAFKEEMLLAEAAMEPAPDADKDLQPPGHRNLPARKP